MSASTPAPPSSPPADPKENHVTKNPILRYFAYDHLTRPVLRDTSKVFHDLAGALDENLPDGPEKSTALRKLLESKDAAVRAALDIEQA